MPAKRAAPKPLARLAYSYRPAGWMVDGNSAIHPTKPAFRANALAVAGP